MPRVLGHVPVGAGEEHAVVGVVGARAPQLLPVDDPLVAVADAHASVSPARSEPLPGSLNSWHHVSSPVSVGASSARFSSSDPWASSVGAASAVPDPTAGPTAPAAASSSATTASAQPGDSARTTRSATSGWPSHWRRVGGATRAAADPGPIRPPARRRPRRGRHRDQTSGVILADRGRVDQSWATTAATWSASGARRRGAGRAPSGGSYGSSMPVMPVSSPARALA